jgi:hypothetical protein
MAGHGPAKPHQHGKHHHGKGHRRHGGSRFGYGWQPPWWAQQQDDDDGDDDGGDGEYEYEGEYQNEEFEPPSDSGRWVRQGDKIVVLNAWR